MGVKTTVALALCLIAVALILVIAIYIGRVAAAIKKQDCQLAEKMLSIVRAIVITLATLIGGAGASTLMTGCTAMRSITVQGTVIQRHDSDTTRVIISSQESYKGMKK